MGLLYLSEHLVCKNYENGTKPMVELFKLTKRDKVEREIEETEIVFVREGQVDLSYENIKNKKVEKGQMILFPSGVRMIAEADEDFQALICRIRGCLQLCDRYTLENLFTETDYLQIEHAPLSVNNKVGEYFDYFLDCIKDGLYCRHYLDIKIKELFFLLRAYYPKEELAGFFRPLMSADVVFSDFVWKNYRKARSVAELALLSRYGLSTFKVRFKRIFGVPALKWLNERKACNVYHELNCSQKSLKQISAEYHFASVSHMTTFCREKLLLTPGQIRNQRVQKKDAENIKSDKQLFQS